jgi:AcrR family transcriptional regulator
MKGTPMEIESRREREKKVRESEIIQAAELIFRQKGYEDTSMDDIAREAQFTKRTLYQYFASKENLLFAVLQKGMSQFQNYLTGAIDRSLTGYEMIRQIMQASYHFYQEYPEFFMLMNQVSIARQRMTDDGENRQAYFTTNDAMFESMAMLIKAGQADGSIAAELDAAQTSMSMLFLMTAFFNQIAVTGNSFSTHFNMDPQDFSTYTMDLIMRILKK